MKHFTYCLFFIAFLFLSLSLNAQTVTQSFYLDFGRSDGSNGNVTVNPDLNGNYWTNIVSDGSGSPTTKSAGYTVSLLNAENNATSYVLETTTTFRANGRNNGALLNPNQALLGDMAVHTATEDYFFIENNLNNKGAFVLKNLDPTKAYKFYVFGSRSGNDSRIAVFSVSGLYGSHGTHQTTGSGIGQDISNTNDSKVWESDYVQPKANGEIVFEVGILTGGYAYINAMKIEEYTDYQLPVVEKKLYIDFGKNNNGLDGTLTSNPDIHGNHWNNMYSNGDGPTTGAANPTVDLILSDGTAANNYQLQTGSTFQFNGVRNGGLLAPDVNLLGDLAIATATQDYLFIDGNNANATLYFKNLNGNKRYRFYIFGSRIQATGDPRIGFVEIIGAKAVKGLHQMGGANVGGAGIHQNVKNVFVSDLITPNSEGQISVVLTKWLGGFAHINLMKVEEIEGGNWATAIDINGNDISTCGGSAQMTVLESPRGAFYPAVVWRVDNEAVALINDNGKLYAKDNGAVTITATLTFPDQTVISASKEINVSSQHIGDYSLAVMGSSVPWGQGADPNKGYAALWSQWLSQTSENSWTTTNISIPGNNTTDVTNRWDSDLLPACSKYVYYGLSLGNEGIHERGQPAFDSYRDNMLALISRTYAMGKIPLIGNNYPRGDFNETDYNYVKQLNLLIHEWDVPSINLLGSIDNGGGRWASGYIADNAHPNTFGHAEMFYVFVPTMLDAIAAGKQQPIRNSETSLSVNKSTVAKRISWEPENVAHAFTLSFAFKTTSTGVLASLVNSNQSTAALKINAEGQLVYETESLLSKLTSPLSVNDGEWHQVSLTHYYAWGRTMLYVDGVQITGATIVEKLVPERFYLNDFDDTLESVSFRELFFHRSAMSAQEIQALHDGKMLKSSLEIYAPLDGNAMSESDVLANHAQSLNTLTFEVNAVSSISQTFYDVFNRNGYKEIFVYNLIGERMMSGNNFSLKSLDKFQNGVYLVKVVTDVGDVFSQKILLSR